MMTVIATVSDVVGAAIMLRLPVITFRAAKLLAVACQCAWVQMMFVRP